MSAPVLSCGLHEIISTMFILTGLMFGMGFGISFGFHLTEWLFRKRDDDK